MPQRRSYLICSVQRARSWLLCHALQDTSVLGVAAEYFHRGDELFWRGQWRTATDDGFLQALRERPASANGVWGSKMMWNYFGDALGRLRAWPRLGLGPGAADPVVLAAAFPELRCVWLRRGDKSRQATSWWRAAATGQYALADGEQPAPPPPFDRDAIARLVRYAEECEAGWRDCFTDHAIARSRSCMRT
jgi:LPS sulfotransferase NodH